MTIIYRAPGPHRCGVHQLGPGLAENSVAQCDACGRRYVLRVDDYGLSWTLLRWYHLMAQRGLRDEQVADMPAALPSADPAHTRPHAYEPEHHDDITQEGPMPRYAVRVTRTITEDVTYEVQADNEIDAGEKARRAIYTDAGNVTEVQDESYDWPNSEIEEIDD